MQLTSVRFLQKTQELLLWFDNGSTGSLSLADLTTKAHHLTAIEPYSTSELGLYFDEVEQPIAFSAAQLHYLLEQKA